MFEAFANAFNLAFGIVVLLAIFAAAVYWAGVLSVAAFDVLRRVIRSNNAAEVIIVAAWSLSCGAIAWFLVN